MASVYMSVTDPGFATVESSYQWRILDFSKGAPTGAKTCYLARFFAENCMKMKLDRGGIRPNRPLGSADAYSRKNCLHSTRNFSFHSMFNRYQQRIGGSKGGTDIKDVYPLMVQILSISCSFFLGKIGQIIAFHIHLWSQRPLLREIVNSPLYSRKIPAQPLILHIEQVQSIPVRNLHSKILDASPHPDLHGAIFLIFMRFGGKSGKIIGYRPTPFKLAPTAPLPLDTIDIFTISDSIRSGRYRTQLLISAFCKYQI